MGLPNQSFSQHLLTSLHVKESLSSGETETFGIDMVSACIREMRAHTRVSQLLIWQPLELGDSSFVEGHLVHCRMLGSIPGLCPLDACDMLPLPSFDNQKYLQTLSNVSWRAKSLLVVSHRFRERDRCRCINRSACDHKLINAMGEKRQSWNVRVDPGRWI